MTASLAYHPTESPRMQDPESAAGCPMCGGVVRPQRTGWQCTRCGLAICEGCEGGAGECDTEG